MKDETINPAPATEDRGTELQVDEFVGTILDQINDAKEAAIRAQINANTVILNTGIAEIKEFAVRFNLMNGEEIDVSVPKMILGLHVKTVNFTPKYYNDVNFIVKEDDDVSPSYEELKKENERLRKVEMEYNKFIRIATGQEELLDEEIGTAEKKV